MALHSPRLSTSPLFVFLVGYAISKDFLYLFRAKFICRKFYRWCHDNWPIGQWMIFHAAPDTAYVNHFFPAWIVYDSNPFRRNKSTSRLCRSARSLRDLTHGSSIRSLFRTYERSTCSKSSIHRKMSIDYLTWVTLLHKVDGKTYSLSSEASLSICPRLPWVTLRSKQKQQQNENGGLLWKRVVAWVQRGRASTYGIVWSGEWGRGWLLKPRSAS